MGLNRGPTAIGIAAMLEVEAVTKSYPTPATPLVVLEDINFKADAGDRLVVTGPSGSGKSTLLAILGGLEPPTNGRFQLAGVDPYGLTPAGRAVFRNKNVGVVFQKHHLLESCTAVDNVLLPVIASGNATNEQVEWARELLSRVGLAGRQEHLPAELSGGECQRVAVARALMLKPPLLLADEPTGQLDSQSAGGVIDLLASLVDDTGGLLVLVTHDMSVAEKVACHPQGRQLRLLDGRLLS